MSMKEWLKLFFKNPFSREEKKMSKKYEYKVGDKVRVRDWEDLLQESRSYECGEITQPDGLCFVPTMRRYCGKVGTITEIRVFGSGTRFRLDLGEETCWYSPLSVRLVESAPQKKSDEKTKPVVSEIRTDAERIAALEEEIAKLKEQVKGEDPMGPMADKTKAKALKTILPRVLEKDGHQWVAETEAGLLCCAQGGWTEGKSVLNWHHWSGGKCPVPQETQVVVYMRDGDMGSRAASLWRWDHEKCIDGAHPRDIIAYAVFEPLRLGGT